MTPAYPAPNVRRSVFSAWSVHFYTSLGLVAGFLALLAIIDLDISRALLFLAIALFIDATDGSLARRADVKRWTPRFDGRKLDDIVDYLNYTFIPVIFAYRFGLVAGITGQLVLGLVLILSAYGFCQKAAKTDDGFFTGFPNFWNIVILYLYVFHLSPTVNTLILLFFVILMLAPFKYITHHTARFHRLTMAVLSLFAVTLLLIGITIPDTPAWLILLSLFGPIYYLGMSAYLQFSNRTNPTRAE
jgi:phosphatidylcholine synthase